MIGNGLRLFSRVLDFFAVVPASAVRTCRRYSAPIVQNKHLNISSHEQDTGALLKRRICHRRFAVKAYTAFCAP
jgi:hypothetical protein